MTFNEAISKVLSGGTVIRGDGLEFETRMYFESDGRMIIESREPEHDPEWNEDYLSKADLIATDWQLEIKRSKKYDVDAEAAADRKIAEKLAKKRVNRSAESVHVFRCERCDKIVFSYDKDVKCNCGGSCKEEITRRSRRFRTKTEMQLAELRGEIPRSVKVFVCSACQFVKNSRAIKSFPLKCPSCGGIMKYDTVATLKAQKEET